MVTYAKAPAQHFPVGLIVNVSLQTHPSVTAYLDSLATARMDVWMSTNVTTTHVVSELSA